MSGCRVGQWDKAGSGMQEPASALRLYVTNSVAGRCYEACAKRGGSKELQADRDGMREAGKKTGHEGRKQRRQVDSTTLHNMSQYRILCYAILHLRPSGKRPTILKTLNSKLLIVNLLVPVFPCLPSNPYNTPKALNPQPL